MAVRLDVEPVSAARASRTAERETPRRIRRGRFGITFVRLSTRRHPGPLLPIDDPFALRYLCRV
ncbi:hypothetical protein [Saccharomonospora halophila]|uniref:hypothetical protein n=1 Tax=Saccharomonospora halophila TaxID=129922 RepID=UPI00036630B4|nr:hypothetical protein [Saccharomonospora halophila]